jgi:hypothetical protein
MRFCAEAQQTARKKPPAPDTARETLGVFIRLRRQSAGPNTSPACDKSIRPPNSPDGPSYSLFIEGAVAVPKLQFWNSYLGFKGKSGAFDRFFQELVSKPTGFWNKLHYYGTALKSPPSSIS